MTTKKTASTDVENDDIVQVKLAKSKQKKNAFIFPIIVLFVAVLVQGATIWTGHQADNVQKSGGPFASFDYPFTLARIILVYHLVIMAWPTVLAFKKRQNMLPRLVFIAASTLFLLISAVLPVWIFIIGAGVAEALWAIRVLGPVAIVLHGLSAIWLTRYNEADTDIEQDVNDLPGKEENVKIAKQEYEDADAEYKAHDTRKKGLTTNHEPLKQEASDRNDELEATQKAFDESELVINRNKTKEELDAQNAILTSLRTDIPALTTAVKDESDPDERALLQRELTDKIEERKEVRNTISDLESVLKRQEKDVEDSVLKSNLDAAEEAHRLASGNEMEHQKLLGTATTEAQTALGESTVKAGKLELQTKDRDETKSRIEAANTATKMTWRDPIFGSIMAFIAAVPLYTSIYGWILTEF